MVQRLEPRLPFELAAMMSKTIVLSINTSWNIVNFRTGLIRRLQRDGYEVIAVAPVDSHSPRLAQLGVRHVPIAIDSKGLSPVRDLNLLRAYRRILGQVRPVAYLGWTAKPNVYGTLAARTLGIPVINNVSGLGTAFIRQGILSSIVSRLYRVAFAGSSTVFFQNAEDRDLFVSTGIVSFGKTRLLPGSGIDTGLFTPAPRKNDPASSFAFLLVARLLRDKGVHEFVEAARIVRRSHPSARFQMLGSLDVANRTAIGREEVEQWVAEGVIEYLGTTDDVRAPIAAADCVVLPSYREGMPRSLLEAAAMAKPLIATDVPGCREIARDGQNALLCRVRDAASLAEAMLRMLDKTPPEREAMGMAGRHLAASEFDESIVIDRYLAALDDALGTRRASV